MKKILVFAIVSAFALACKNDCEKAADDMTAKYEECGFEIADGDGDGEEAECTDEAAELATCTADCVTNADCAALDGSDLDLALEYATCLSDCIAK
jgi:hypothetical protein